MTGAAVPQTIQYGQCYTAEGVRVICEHCLDRTCILHPEAAE